jgi:hypothetical protein
MNVLCINNISFIKFFQISFIIKKFSRCNFLLKVNCFISITHIFHDPSFWRYFSFYSSSFCYKSLNLRSVFFNVIIIYMFYSIYIIEWRMMKIAIITKISNLALFIYFFVLIFKYLKDFFTQHFNFN